MPTVGAIELPAIKLVDVEGRNWTALRRREPLVSKQILISQLRAGGFDVDLVNLKRGDQEMQTGEVLWRDMPLAKVLVGRAFDLHPRDYDVWAITINYIQEREGACDLVREIARGGGRVVVGGSDAFAEPEPYLEAGAHAVVRDKSGAANHAVVDYVLGNEPREPLTGVVLPDGRSFPVKRPPMSPQDWPLPSHELVLETLGVEHWESGLPEHLRPIGSVMADIGCDRHCDFCETPLYKLGYKRMDPETALKWFEAQWRAGAASVICPSDQFLGRVLWKEGREEVLAIMKDVREIGPAILWGNGLELKKATLGRGLPDSDLAPDEELVEALWGWDGSVGCYQAYLPAERPTFGREAYAKLLPWREHSRLVESIVRAGVADITYGVIVGLADDNEESLEDLEQGVSELYDRLIEINPDLVFNVTPYAIRPLPGTPQAAALRASGLLRFEDPAIIGGFWTACADTKHMSYERVSDWQTRLATIGSGNAMNWQHVTGAAKPKPESLSY